MGAFVFHCPKPSSVFQLKLSVFNVVALPTELTRSVSNTCKGKRERQTPSIIFRSASIVLVSSSLFRAGRARWCLGVFSVFL
jgi:hypothetical protein